jgi:nucleotide-binding universal stress UspA family protein
MSYETILAAVDLGALSHITLEAAAAFAARAGSKRIHAVHVVHLPSDWIFGPDTFAPSTFDALLTPAEQQLAQMIEALPKMPGVTVDYQVVFGDPARELDTIARKIGANVTVIATHRRGLIGRLILGSIAGTLLRLSTSPLLIVGEDRRARTPFKSVIAAIDLSPAAPAVLRHAQALVDPSGELRVVSAPELEQIVSRMPLEAFRGTSAAQLTELLEGRYYARVQTLVQRWRTREVPMTIDVRAIGLARDIIIDAARETGCDLLVIGTSGHRVWQRVLLGSTAGWVAAHASCPVFVCPMEKQ